MARGGPGPWQELVEAIVRPEINQAGEAIGEPGLGIDIAQFGCFNERGEDGPILGTVIMTREQSILARQSLRAHGTLDDVGVEFDAAIVEDAGEAVPVPEAIADDLGRIRPTRKPRELMLEEDLQRVDERTRSCLSALGAYVTDTRENTVRQ